MIKSWESLERAKLDPTNLLPDARRATLVSRAVGKNESIFQLALAAIPQGGRTVQSVPFSETSNFKNLPTLYRGEGPEWRTPIKWVLIRQVAEANIKRTRFDRSVQQ
jgi:hypothetical protein